MTDGIEAMTGTLVAMALDAASLRQQALAMNIANASTEGYVPQRVDFEAQLEGARQSIRSKGSADPFTVAGVRAQLEPALDSNGLPRTVHLDAEVAKLSENSVQYQALIKGLNRHYHILSLAVSDGK
jgi:flagellar basal-body rod protein FlgB